MLKLTDMISALQMHEPGINHGFKFRSVAFPGVDPAEATWF